MLLLVVACVALLHADGLWNNAIRLINIILAALVATNFYEPLAQALDDAMPVWTYVWDILSIWGLFGAAMFVFQSATERASRVKVKFPEFVDRIGGAFLALWISWVLLCFTMMTLHTAPLVRNFMFGAFQPEIRMMSGLAPDRQWLGFVQRLSLGAFCRWATREEQKQETYAFDPGGKFIDAYAARRSALESHVNTHDSIFVSQ
jgi:hypothetical protein